MKQHNISCRSIYWQVIYKIDYFKQFNSIIIIFINIHLIKKKNNNIILADRMRQFIIIISS